ncbi:hypothetical protein [Rhizobium wenxiniae]|uniref:hypothetical protein n=1 Tax=Rhizobium wenxiniae TaxID=1737357 RepID=UPI001CB7A539|nr:hypothetical protein [Rhizobium wenxiniae]
MTHGVALKIFPEIRFAHDALPASKLGKKVSTNLGAIQTEYPQPSRLSFNDAVCFWLRHWSGEFQHHIAASYGVNPGRVSEVLKRRKHLGSEQETTIKKRAN